MVLGMLYVLVLTFVSSVSGNVSSGSIDNVQFKTKQECERYVKYRGYENTKSLTYTCVK